MPLRILNRSHHAHHPGAQQGAGKSAIRKSCARAAWLASLLLAATALLMATAALPVQPTPGGTTGTAVDSWLKDLIVITGVSVTYDSNLFRNPGLLVSRNPTPSPAAISDCASTNPRPAAISARYHPELYPLRQIQYLDFDALNYSGAWNWKLGTRVSGKLSASRSESLAPFEDTLGFGRNVRISQNQAFDLDGWMVDGWHLLLGVSQADQKSEQKASSTARPTSARPVPASASNT